MAISDTVASMRENLGSAWDSLEAKGAALPEQKNMANLAPTIDALETKVEINFDANPEAYAAIKGVNEDTDMVVMYLDGNAASQILAGQFNFATTGIMAYYEIAFAPKASTLATQIGDGFLGDLDPTAEPVWERKPLEISKLTGLDNLTQVTSIGNNFLRSSNEAAPRSLTMVPTLPPNLETIGNNFCTGSKTIVGLEAPLPNSVTTIGDNFLSQCSVFNAPVKWPTSLTSLGSQPFASDAKLNQPLTIPEAITEIPFGFAQSCQSFNSPVTIPGTVTTIGAYFLANNPVFDQPVTVPAGVTIIRNNFLSDCQVFNSAVTLPEGLETIQDNFLNGCLAFAQPLVQPSTATFEGNYSLNRVPNFVGPLTCNGPAPVPDVQNAMLAQYWDPNSPIYTQGVTLQGPTAAAWATALPNNDGTNGQYRKLIVAN